MKTQSLLQHYDLSKLTIGVLGSHSALDICLGAKKEGLQTLVVAEKGREKTYKKYYKANDNLGCVDDCLVLDKFSDILKIETQKKLRERNTIFIPHRSFEAYLNFDYQSIEKRFNVPMFGNRKLLKIEERGQHPNQYDLLKEANIHYPVQFKKARDINKLSLVKVLEKERGFERAFFLVENYRDFQEKVAQKLKAGIFSNVQLKSAVIEEFVAGVNVNFNFFYSPLTHSVELLGTDTRRQTNLEGITGIPAPYQEEVLKNLPVQYEEAGHIAVTVLESLLELAFDLAERFVRASQKFIFPGIIGPFALQTIVTPGPPKKDIVVIDVSPRVPGSPGISATPYSSYLFGEPVSVGKRLAREIKEGVRLNRLDDLVS